MKMNLRPTFTFACMKKPDIKRALRTPLPGRGVEKGSYAYNRLFFSSSHTFTILTDLLGSATDEKANNKYCKEQKLAMMAHIAGGKLTKEAKFYTDWNCAQGFPVDNPQWTARELVQF